MGAASCHLLLLLLLLLCVLYTRCDDCHMLLSPLVASSCGAKPLVEQLNSAPSAASLPDCCCFCIQQASMLLHVQGIKAWRAGSCTLWR
jgi:hypothetical protein